MDLVTYDDYDKISMEVRRFCAQKLISLEATLHPYINGDYGDITPGHLNAYITLIKELGRLYKAQAAPRDPEATMPISKVQQLLEAAEARTQTAVDAAIQATEARIMQQLELQAAGDLQHARTQVLARLEQVRS